MRWEGERVRESSRRRETKTEKGGREWNRKRQMSSGGGRRKSQTEGVFERQ